MNDNTMAVVVTSIIASGVVMALFVYHVGRALADRIRGPARSGTAEELRSLRDDLTNELHALRTEVAELAERVDFAERLLAKEREAARLAPPGGR